VSAQKFAQAWEKDPVHAVDMFVAGLGRIKDSGGNVVGTLSQLGITGTQNLNVLLRLSGAGDMLTKSIDQSNGAWEKNNALALEVEKRYQTTAAQIEIARNQLVDASIDIGTTLLPALAAVVSTGRDLIAFWAGSPRPAQDRGHRAGVADRGHRADRRCRPGRDPEDRGVQARCQRAGGRGLKTAGMRLSGMAGVLAGPWGLALAGGITALGIFAAKHEAAKREVDALAASLDQQTGAITENTRQQLLQEVATNGILDDARTLGLSLGAVTAAYMGNKDASPRCSR
jgi:hypothetical protein